MISKENELRESEATGRKSEDHEEEKLKSKPDGSTSRARGTFTDIASIIGGTTDAGDDKSKKKNNTTKNKKSKVMPLPTMFLSQCHKFHTNPALSSPNSVQRTKTISNTNHNGPSTNSAADTNTANVNNPNSSNILSKALKRKQRLAQYKGQTSSPGNPLSPITFDLGPGLPCHAVWAPNSNYCKNAELLAIASPLNLNAIHNASSGGSQNGAQNPLTNNQTANNLNANTSGSNVYVLVFDEGTFAHGGEFNLADELCELFGLPTEKMPNDERLKEVRCGLRRPVFHNSNLKEDSKLDSGNDTTNTGLGKDDGDDAQEQQVNHSVSIADQIQVKVHTMYRDITTKSIKPFAAHVVDEIKNCHRMFENEVFGDGRIFSRGVSSRTKKRKNTPSTDDVVEDSYASNKSPCPTKPQLVFHVNLPYSNTAMEVTGLDWNADGTTLSISQRRKGSPNSFSTVSSSSTNKKKKASLNTISPGNTAVSFWSIPEWLHVACDELKMCDENDDLRYDNDGSIIFKNNTVEDSVGWEVGVIDENRSLFPLWEWYLAKYIFHDEQISADATLTGQRSRIMMKNCMEYIAYPMELTSTPASTSTSRGGKKAIRGTRGAATSSDNANSIMNGDMTCLIWEESQITKFESSEEEKDNGTKGNGGSQEKDKESNNVETSSNTDSNDNGDALIPASKWVAIGTNKGQMILHNGAASYLSYQTKKASRKGDTDKSTNFLSNVLNSSPQGRTIVVPLRHKKRITCGAWAENILVFGHVSTGSLTLVSTFPKPALIEGSDANSKSCNLFTEKSVKVLGSILLPGGRDAVKIYIGHVDDDITILSVNCEGKSLLFYTFPRFVDSTNTTAQASNITSSPAMELNFSIMSNSNLDDAQNPSQLKGTSHCGNIIFHYLIPDTLLVLVAFSSGYFALVDWVNGVILSDEDIARQSHRHTNGAPSSRMSDNTTDFPRESQHDNFLLDVTFHVATSTVACVTQDGNVLVYFIRILDGCHDVTAGDCICKTGITISTKTHTRPKTKISSNLVDCDSSLKRIMGTIDFLCAHSIPRMPVVQSDARKGDLINFSSDGECISVSLGDESIVLFSINVEDYEADQLKQRIAESIYLGRDNILMFFIFIICASLIWQFGKLEVSQSDYAFVEYL